MKINGRTTLAVLALVSLLASHTPAGAQTDAQEERIARVERGLQTRIRIAGRPVERHSIEERMAAHNVPGVSVAVIDGGEIVWARGYGVRDAETRQPVTERTLFQAASISKPVAAMGMLALVERGKLDLDQDVNRYLTTWRVPAHSWEGPVSLRRIVSHTAGLTVHGFPGYDRSVTLPSTVGVLDGDGNTPPIFVDVEPGSVRRYSGGGYTVLQQLLEDVTGRPFADLLHALVLGPAAMRSSTYEQPLPEHHWAHAASGHRGDGSRVSGGWHVYPEQAAAGLWTTPTDLAGLAVEVQCSLRGEANHVLSQEMTAHMLEPLVDDQGLGFASGRGPAARFGHGGSNEGFRAIVTAFHHTGQGAAIMTNGDRGGALYQEILFAIAEEYGWEGVEPREITQVEWPQARRTAFEGSFDVVGRPIRLTFRWDGDLLAMTSEQVPPASFATVEIDRLVDLGDGTPVRVVWDGDRVVELGVQGLTLRPVR